MFTKQRNPAWQGRFSPGLALRRDAATIVAETGVRVRVCVCINIRMHTQTHTCAFINSYLRAQTPTETQPGLTHGSESAA